MNWIFYVIALLAGCLVAVQAGVNSQLRQQIGQPVLAALLSFAVGTVALLLYLLLTDRSVFSSLSSAGQVQWWKWTGGLLGAFYVTGVIFAAPRLGAATTMGLIVAGQLILAVVLDHFGWVGFAVHSLSLWRVMGVVLLLAGVYLILKN